ncbi:TetR/AcrR family transcriptional regulator [Allokutzneria multivorans]|uniref:TetR/AcrR family transcriptional regulator n=1 Tax=Allokutzneria multivorans TaxID=1142134 RepID=A0ABP7REE9_9PSEU
MVTDRDQVLRAAASLLVRNHGASMTEVAEAAGISRATLHRVVPNRDALLDQLLWLGLGETVTALTAARPEAGAPLAALERVVVALTPVAELFRFVTTQPLDATTPEFQAGFHALDERLTALFLRGQDSGAFRGDLPATWMVDALASLLFAAALAARAGRLPGNDNPRAVIDLLVGGVTRGETE